MAAVLSKVIAGEYEGKDIFGQGKELFIELGGLFKKTRIPLSKRNIKSYNLVDSEKTIDGVSAVSRGLIGGFLLGPIGIAAALSAKKKGAYTLEIEFVDGKRSLILLSDGLYKDFIKIMF